jgi:diguanylate cyclase (GGDEF)-like protein
MPDFRPSWTQVTVAIVVILAVQRAGFILLGPTPSAKLFLDFCILFASTLAILCCLFAARRATGVARIFWLLFGAAISLQWVADAGWTWYHFFHIHIADNALFPSVFYRFYAGPMAIALFLSDDVRLSRIESFLDSCIIVGLVSLTMFQLQMAEMSAHDATLWQLITVSTAVNFVLVLASAARFWVTGSGALHRLYSRQAIYLAIYTGVALSTSYVDAYIPGIDDSFDLIWIVTYLAAAAIAITWRPPLQEEPSLPRIGRRTALLAFNLTLAAMVLGCAILGYRIASSTRAMGLIAITVVLFSYAIRSSLMQDKQENTLDALQQSRAALQQQALYDELTTLPNRRLFTERLNQTLAIAQREGYSCALLYFDFDGFKPVNDLYGHAVGDLLLQQASLRLLARVRKTDTLARMGGDDFTLLLAHIADPAQASVVAEGIQHALSTPFQIDGHTLSITASIGIGIHPNQAEDDAALIHQADTAMYAVKRSGKNGIRFYSPDLS